MNVIQAMDILRPYKATMKDIKSAYRRMAQKFHPDINATDGEMMKLVNLAYEHLLATAWAWESSKSWRDWEQADPEEPSLLDEMQKIFDKLERLPDIRVEMIGEWLWVFGNTDKYAIRFVGIGLRYSMKRGAWYWHPKDFWIRRRSNRKEKNLSVDDMRSIFGSRKLKTNPRKQI